MTPASFDATGPLPRGRVLLEASAGTGKTWTIAALVTRFVAEEGIPIDEMLVVTFTRAATSELRERTRSRLATAARHLRESVVPPKGEAHRSQDGGSSFLPPEGEVRRSRDGGDPTTDEGSLPEDGDESFLPPEGEVRRSREGGEPGRDEGSPPKDTDATFLPPEGEVRRSRDGGDPERDQGSPPTSGEESFLPPEGEVRRCRDGGESPTTEDPILIHLADCDPTERALRLRRLEDALRSFDRATITTLHGLAHRFLVEMGLLARTSLPNEIVTDHNAEVADVLNDLYVAMFADTAEPPAVRTAAEIANRVAATPDADILPAPGEVDGPADVWSRFAHEVRHRLDERAARGRTTSYDGLLLAARDAVVHPDTGPMAAGRLTQRYRLALIDEFQDTDSIQWQTVDAVFGDLAATMILIGDPKQSIYAFRGADIGAYLDASRAATSTFTLGVNWRSDQALLDALDVVFEGVTFGDERIPYRTVSAAPGRSDRAIRGVDAPLVIRGLGRNSQVRTIFKGTLAVGAARETIAEDAAAYVVRLLSTPAQLCEDDEWRPVRPGDIAILCRSRYEVDLVRSALSARNVPSVTGRTGNVLLSDAADAWLALLAALEYASPRRVRATALTAFFGWTAADLSAATDDDLLPLFETIAGWAEVLATEGVAGLWTTIEQTSGVTRRTLGTEGGERLLTDLGHITEMIHTAHRAGALSLHGWLLASVQDAADHEDDDEERARRLETDSDAVQVLTAHASKGLEFPVVLCPFLWNKSPAPANPPVFHPAGSDRRFIEVGGDGSSRHDEAVELAAAESAAEEMRLLYVALTRARHHTAVWWAWCDGTETTPLTRFLFRRNGNEIDNYKQLVSDARLWGYLDRRVAETGDRIAHHMLTERPDRTFWEPPTPTAPVLESARFGRPIDLDWTRTSFSGLTADSRHASHVDAPAEVKTDEPEPEETDEPVTVSPELPMASLPGGASFGSMVHAVFEDVDLAADDRAERILDVCRTHIASSGSDADPETLAAALLGVAGTPLFADPASTRLVDIGRRDQLVEMVFDLPVSPEGATVPVAEMARLLETHLPDSHSLRPYADRLRSLSRTRFRGFLTGAIDATVRLGEPSRFWIMDYKTNRLGDPSRTLTLDDYRPAALDEAMIHGDYVLQSLLYQVALHRYLGVRLPGYRPDTHLGGSLYLFVRGMIGADTPATVDGRFGVHRWDAPTELIVALSDLFERGQP